MKKGRASTMATVILIDGRPIENVRLTDIERVGDEGSRKAIAHIGENTYPVHNSIIDGFNDIWYEQISLETWRMTKGATGFVEGSVTIVSDERIIDAVRDAAARYWSGANEPTQIEQVQIEKRDTDGDVQVKVSWISESTKDSLRDDMIYTVSTDGSEIVDVFGPEW